MQNKIISSHAYATSFGVTDLTNDEKKLGHQIRQYLQSQIKKASKNEDYTLPASLINKINKLPDGKSKVIWLSKGHDQKSVVHLLKELTHIQLTLLIGKYLQPSSSV